MPQGVLPFKYEKESTASGMTALAGLLVYLDLLHHLRFRECVDHCITVRSGSQGWNDSQIVTALIMLNLAGGDCVDDLRVLETDEGFRRILALAQCCGLSRPERRSFERRWRRKTKRTVPSASAAFRYLNAFHDPAWDENQVYGKSWIPHNFGQLKGFSQVNAQILAFAQRNAPSKTATLDMDATLIETHKKQALCCYKHFKAYQPMNVWWAEQELFVQTEFRAGNVHAGFEQHRVFMESLELLPDTVERVSLRSDTAGYQFSLLNYCELAENKRFGRIEFTVSCPMKKAFKQAVSATPESAWRRLYRIVKGKKVSTGREWAEIYFITEGAGIKKNSPVYRYLATRERIEEQLPLPGVESSSKTDALEEPETIAMNAVKYRVFGLVSNMDWSGDDLIRWHYQRCGKSEHAHSGLKEDLAGGKLPSGRFGANAAWWWISVLAFNLNAILKNHAMEKGWKNKRMKAVRFSLINIPGRVVQRSRQWFIRLDEGCPFLPMLIEIRKRIAAMRLVPT